MRFVKRGSEYFLYPESDKETEWVKREFGSVRQLRGKMVGDEKSGIFVEVRLAPVEVKPNAGH